LVRGASVRCTREIAANKFTKEALGLAFSPT